MKLIINALLAASAFAPAQVGKTFTLLNAFEDELSWHAHLCQQGAFQPLVRFYIVYTSSVVSAAELEWLNGRASVFGTEGCGFEPRLEYFAVLLLFTWNNSLPRRA
mmetsp:Transcript_34713/g.52374  ORF Transcript_34713/g.52374 Transcript_34713/m.52374 type:complete len:106 (+) Transcript_34713:1525-1842(+)